MMASKRKYVVTTSSTRPVATVADELRRSGFTVAQVLDAIGIVMGSCTPAVAERLRAHPDVVDVSPDADVDIGPPDAPVS